MHGVNGACFRSSHYNEPLRQRIKEIKDFAEKNPAFKRVPWTKTFDLDNVCIFTISPSWLHQADTYNKKKMKFWYEDTCRATMTASQLMRQSEEISFDQEVPQDEFGNIGVATDFDFDPSSLTAGPSGSGSVENLPTSGRVSLPARVHGYIGLRIHRDYKGPYRVQDFRTHV